MQSISLPPDRGRAIAEATKLVAVIDDDPAVRELIRNLLTSIGLRVETYGSAQELVAHIALDSMNCLVLDVRLPGKNGLDFHDDLRRAQVPASVVYITGYGDIPMSVRAMRGGAVDFLTKPFSAQELLDAVQRGIEQDRSRRDRHNRSDALRAKMTSLTPRERQVMAQVVGGLRNKQVADTLGISEVTVKAHRHKVMSKMGAATFADLVRMSLTLWESDQ